MYPYRNFASLYPESGPPKPVHTTCIENREGLVRTRTHFSLHRRGPQYLASQPVRPVKPVTKESQDPRTHQAPPFLLPTSHPPRFQLFSFVPSNCSFHVALRCFALLLDLVSLSIPPFPFLSEKTIVVFFKRLFHAYTPTFTIPHNMSRRPGAAGNPLPAAGRQNEYFVPRDGIDREVITADICRYLGNDALVRPGTYEV